MRRRRSCWRGCSRVLALLVTGLGQTAMAQPSDTRAEPAERVEKDTTHWLVRVNKLRVLDVAVGEPCVARLAILKRADVIYVDLFSSDTSAMSHVLEVVDVRGQLVRRFQYTLALPGRALAVPVADLLERRSFMQGRYRITYANAAGRRLTLAELEVAGTD